MERHRSVQAVLAVVMAVLLAATCAGCSLAGDDTEGPAPVSPSSSAWSSSTLVSTSSGQLRGHLDSDVVRFQGVPYARPPVGAARFAPPQPVTPWTGEREASTSAKPCPQLGGAGEVVGSEDCLYLDVTVPAATSDQPRPVMVWFHGGGFTEGSAPAYDPRQLAVGGDVVVVTVGYRLGALGQMAPAGAEDGGVFGLADQQQALRVVAQDAQAFGGDPQRVTIFGESAGGTAVCSHLASPTARGLFQRAIIQSAIECGAPAPPGAYGLPDPAVGSTVTPSMQLRDVQTRTEQAVAQLGCLVGEDAAGQAAQLECLRQVPVEALLPLGPQFARYAVGGPLLPQPPVEALGQVDVPVLAGYTRDEARFYPLLAALLGHAYPEGSYEPAVRASFGDRAEQVLARYPLAEYASDAEAWAAVYTDSTWACPQLHANDVMAAGGAHVYTYEFADRTAPSPLPVLPGAPAPGAAHSSELPYLFDVDGQPIDITGQPVPLSATQRQLAGRMRQVWADFARTGTAPVRPWVAGSGQALIFQDGGTTTDDPALIHRCDLW